MAGDKYHCQRDGDVGRVIASSPRDQKRHSEQNEPGPQAHRVVDPLWQRRTSRRSPYQHETRRGSNHTGDADSDHEPTSGLDAN